MSSEGSVSSIARDLDQSAVVEAPPSSRAVVTAGPGTGKTRTLLARAQRLSDRDEIEPATELLVLSFSRAAVETVAQRGVTETSLGRLPVRTIDSFAGWILAEADIALERTSYDGRIAAATEALADGSRVAELVESIGHVLVDEAQDVVGVRAMFVHRLLELICRRPTSGFTVFGDTAQAIFDFQLGSSSKLLDLIEADRLATEHRELKTNHRMSDERLAAFASSVGASLREDTHPDGWPAFYRDVCEEVFLEAGWTRLDDAIPEVRAACEAPDGPRVAVLCRTNAEALWIGSHLQSAGLDVTVQHRARDRGGAPWLATLFGDAPFSRARIPGETAAPEGRPWLQPPADLLRLLRQAGLARDKEIDLKRLASMLRSGACPDRFSARRDVAVTVSTIHRAKGLEYDTVFVVETGRPCEEKDALEEAKVMYVAATRARDELLGGVPIDLGGQRGKLSDKRATVRAWDQGRRLTQVEVNVSDSDGEWAPEGLADFYRIQNVLAEDLVPGEEIELRLSAEKDGDDRLYDLILRGGEAGEMVVGRTRPAFGRMLKREVGRTPKRISGLIADIPDAAAMPTPTAQSLGLGDHGIHLRARVFGLGRLG